LNLCAGLAATRGAGPTKKKNRPSAAAGLVLNSGWPIAPAGDAWGLADLPISVDLPAPANAQLAKLASPNWSMLVTDPVRSNSRVVLVEGGPPPNAPEPARWALRRCVAGFEDHPPVRHS
jgi:hypothetical protein